MRPPTVAHIVGHAQPKTTMTQYARACINLLNGAQDTPPPLMCVVWGPPGVGKTSLVHALCADMNLHVHEINASDTRSGAKIKQQILQNLPFKHMTTGRPYSVILDEADGIDEDSITPQDIADAVRGLPRRGPLWVIANSKRPLLMRSLCQRRDVIEVRMGLLNPSEISSVCARAGVCVSEAARNGGDARAALNSSLGSAAKHAQPNAFQTADSLLSMPVQTLQDSVQALVLNDPEFCLKIMHDNADRTASPSDLALLCSDADLLHNLHSPDHTATLIAQWAVARTAAHRGRKKNFSAMTVRRSEYQAKPLDTLASEVMLQWDYDTCCKWLRQRTTSLDDLKRMGHRFGAAPTPLPAQWVRAFRDTHCIT